MPRFVYLAALALLLPTFKVTAQERVIKDLDQDRVADTVYYDQTRNKIICRLSSQGFREIESQALELGANCGVRLTKNGFEYFEDFMRAGYACQFRYEPKTKAVTLIGMSRYEFGNAANDGSGKGSVNLLTGDLVGEWHYYDHEKEKLIKLPVIKGKMRLPKVTLQEFSDAAYWRYAEADAARYEKAKKQYQAAH